jgi:hypothetical protein
MASPATKKAARIHKIKSSNKLLTLAFYGIIIAILLDGWINRNDSLIKAESGIGYLFGIIGGSLMLLMLLYSARKRARFMRRMGKVSYWFRMHMLFGILGPSFILYHSNFSQGSLNSTIALYCMLLVAISGLIGRYIYSHIHYGLYGEQATVIDLRNEKNIIMQALSKKVPFSESLVERLKQFEDKVLRRPKTPLHAFMRHIFVSFRLFFAQRSLIHYSKGLLREKYLSKEMSKQEAYQANRVVKHYIKAYMARLHKVSELSFFERLFSLWHVLHVPFFIMMIITGIVHVIAVHVY